MTVLLLITLTSFYFKFREKQRMMIFSAAEKPRNFIANSMQTKHAYQRAFKKARQYNYPITVVYFTVENWQELIFRFNKKSIINEVVNDISLLINEHLSEFDCAGLINPGEYLLMFEHQTTEEIILIVDKLSKALKVRFFANLGNFSISCKYTVKTPSFKDIDPYIFLARLSESIVQR